MDQGPQNHAKEFKKSAWVRRVREKSRDFIAKNCEAMRYQQEGLQI